LSDLEKKIKDIENELAMPNKEFERKLAERLREEIKMNKMKLDDGVKKELQEEKRRLIAQVAKEKEELKNENKQLVYEISRLKVIMRG